MKGFFYSKMNVVKSVQKMQSFSENLRLEGKKIACVPTMGYFHEGHLALMREARKQADCVVVSIYVNPTQFGPQEDFSKYPRNFDRDMKMAQNVGVDVIFTRRTGQCILRTIRPMWRLKKSRRICAEHPGRAIFAV